MVADLVAGEWASRAPGGPALFGRSWRPPTSPRASILIVHGLAEHSGRYAATAAALTGAGFGVHAVDYRGHGKSEGGRVHVDDVDEYVSDVRAALEQVRRHDPALPVFLLGHSQGGLVALKLALDDPGATCGLVVTSPFLAVHPSSRPSAGIRALAKVMLRLAPRLPMPTHIDARLLSRDPAAAEAYARDPLVSRAASAGWLRAIGRAQRDVRRGAPRLRVPTLMINGHDDFLYLVDSQQKPLFDLLGAPRDMKKHVVLDGVGHMPPPRADVIREVLAWFDTYLGPVERR